MVSIVSRGIVTGRTMVAVGRNFISLARNFPTLHGQRRINQALFNQLLTMFGPNVFVG